MIIKTKHAPSDFITIAKGVIFNNTLSWKAKGILTYLMGHPENWETRVEDLMQHGTDGERAIRSGLQELRDKGYAKLTALREKGKIIDWRWEISDRPLKTKPDVQNSNLVKPQKIPEMPVNVESSPDCYFADVQNSYYNKKEINKKDQDNKKEGEPKKEKRAAPASDSTTVSHAPKPQERNRGELKPYGEFQNIFLSDEERAKLLDRIGKQPPACVNGGGVTAYLDELIEAMSRYKTTYQDHYKALLNWYARDLKRVEPIPQPASQWQSSQPRSRPMTKAERNIEIIMNS